MKIAYVVRNGFYPPFNGERVKSASLASALAACGPLTIVDLGRADYPDGECPEGASLPLPYGGVAKVFSMLVYESPANRRRADAAVAGGESVRLSRIPAFRRAAAGRLLHALRPEVVVVDHPLLARLALRAGPAYRIVHAHNVESRLAAAIHAAKGGLRQRIRIIRLRHNERRLLPRLDQVWAVSEPDAGVFRELGVASVRVTPNIVPATAFVEESPAGTPGHAAFFGWLSYPPNAEAVAYLLDRVGRLPEWRRLTLIGRGLPAELEARARKMPEVRCLGFVEEIATACRDAAAILVPLARGAGTKLKVIEALAMGKPLVTTPSGAEGLALVDGEHAHIAPPGPEFDARACAVLRDPEAARRLAASGQALARAHYSQGSLDRAVADALAALPRFVGARSSSEGP